MRPVNSLIIFFCLLIFHSSYGQTDITLATQIDSLYIKDQSVQLQFKQAVDNKVAFDSIQKLQTAEKQIFDRHIPILKDIINKNGYPTIKKVGTDASTHFFTLIQHSDSDPVFQASMLPLLKKFSARGEISKKDYASCTIGFKEIQVKNNYTELNFRLTAIAICLTAPTKL